MDRPITSPSGSAMDRRIERKPWRKALPWTLGLGAAAALAAVWLVVAPGAGAKAVKASEVEITAVRRAPFHDYLPARGEVTPLQTVYVDSVEGGQVASLAVADGALVRAGDLIAVLANPQLQRDTGAREAEVSGRISDVRGQLLQLERSRADRRRELDQARYDLIKAEQTLAVRQSLHDKGFVSDVELRTVQAEADFRRTQTRTLQAAVDQEASMVTRQSGEIQRTLDQLQGNLASVRRSLDALNVRAPASGRLTAFELQPGQTVKPGDRIGQIDTEGAYKLAAQIDEFYLGRVALGQAASVRQDGRTYRAAVSRILPQVRNGRFQIELQFQGAHPAALRRGQTLDLEVTLGDTRPALILPNGPYLEATGGSWIFVVDKSGRRAERRMIKTGRRNPLEVEVLGGLQPGERVLTSSYQGFADQTRLILR